MREWMEEHEYESVEQLKGSMSQKNCPDPSAFERAQYMRALADLSGARLIPPAALRCAGRKRRDEGQDLRRLAQGMRSVSGCGGVTLSAR